MNSRSHNLTVFLLTVACLLSCNIAWAQDSGHQRLTNLPHLYINTFDGRDVTSKETQVYARLWLIDEQDQEQYYDSVLIRGRGNSTWNMEKKPYRIKFPQKERFLGKDRANAKKWTLLANHGDKTLFRNALASYVGNLCGQTFTPGARFVDLTLNGHYRGTYQLSDQLDVRKRRVDIAEQDYPLNNESDISGGYLVEADGFADHVNGKTGWRTQLKGVPMTIHYPDEEEISPTQYNYIRSFVNTFESRLLSLSFESASSYRHYVDTLSLVSWYLASEVTANPDYVWSLYFYKDRGDQRLHFGPLWDFDIAFDNDNRLENDHHDPLRQLMATIGFTNNGMEDWIRRLWQDPWFQRLVFDHYTALVGQGLQAKLTACVDSLATLLQQSQQLNYERWNIRQRTLREVVLYSTYDEYVANLHRFIAVRIPALLSAFASRHPDHPNPDDYITIEPDFLSKANYYYIFANAGTQTVVDVDADGLIVANARREGSESQQWLVTTLHNGYHHIVNRLSGLALTDLTEGEATATTNLGTQLAVTTADSGDVAQQWHIVAQADGRYNLNNRRTNHTANLTGGNAANGTTILSYTNDQRNSESMNRLWTITVADSMTIETTVSTPLADMAYALAYDPFAQCLHFGSDRLADLRFTVLVYDAAGRPVLRFNASEEADVSHLPRGLYVVAWQWQGRRHSAKFMR